MRAMIKSDSLSDQTTLIQYRVRVVDRKLAFESLTTSKKRIGTPQKCVPLCFVSIDTSVAPPKLKENPNDIGTLLETSSFSKYEFVNLDTTVGNIVE